MGKELTFKYPGKGPPPGSGEKVNRRHTRAKTQGSIVLEGSTNQLNPLKWAFKAALAHVKMN